jgi:hypothetical protein
MPKNKPQEPICKMQIPMVMDFLMDGRSLMASTLLTVETVMPTPMVMV